MALFQHPRRPFIFSFCLSAGLIALSACGGDRGDDPPADASTGADTGSTGGSAGSSGRGGSGGSAGSDAGGKGGSSATGGAAGASGGSGGSAGSSGGTGGKGGGAVDAGRDGTTDVRIDTVPDVVDAGPDVGGTCTSDVNCPSGHCVGGVCCAVACNTPGTCEKADGATCPGGTACRYLKAADDTVCDADNSLCTNDVCFNGTCVFKSNKDCADTDQCTADTCTPSTGACVHTPVDVAVFCNDNNPCTNDTCSSAAGCLHSDNNTATCSDNDACTDDVCQAGVCVSTPKNCSSLNNDCNVGACVNGACQAQPSNANGACDEGLVACDQTGKCNTTGQCVGQRDACGALATTCAACTNEPGCFNGRLCTCPAGSSVINGKCVAGTDECAATPSPCVAGATCSDPTPDGSTNGDVVCTCPAGYTGNGKVAGTGCTDIDECNGANPCGAGSTCNNTPGSYTCTCATGLRSIPTSTGPTCVCDLSGTYALSVKTMVGFDAVSVLGIKVIEESPPGGVETYRWALRHQTIDNNGVMTVKSVACGGTAPDACDLAFGYAHAQYQPNHIWGKAKINAGATTVTKSLVGVVPTTGSYVEPNSVQLLGISLADPNGAWPPCRACVGVEAGQTCTCGTTTHTVSNKATWVDVDDDGQLGITNLHVPRGGINALDGTPPDPPFLHPEPTACPRLGSSTGTYGYQEWPGTVGLTQFRTNRFFVATRMTTGLSSTSITVANNACTISGNVTGPANGKARVEQRTQGCETCSASFPDSCVPGPACTSDQVASYDDVPQTQRVEAETFTLTKATNIDLGAIFAMPDGTAKDNAFNAACNEMRETYCPAGKNCNTP
jgi:hypothetical protein